MSWDYIKDNAAACLNWIQLEDLSLYFWGREVQWSIYQKK